METVELTQDNISEYTGFFGEDMAENIGRIYYCGLAVNDGEDTKAGLIWEYRNLDIKDESEGHIVFFRTMDAEAADIIFTEYHKMAAQNGVRKTTFVIPIKDSKLEKEVLKKEGFTVRLTESDQIIVQLSELSAMPLMEKRKIPEGIKPLEEITVRKFRNGIDRSVRSGHKGVCEDLEALTLGWFNQEVSCCYEKDDKVKAMLLFHKLPSEIISIQLMVCMDQDFGRILPGLMRKFVITCEELYPPDTRILLNRHDEASFALSEKLLPRGFGIPVYAGSREEKDR